MEIYGYELDDFIAFVIFVSIPLVFALFLWLIMIL